MNKKKLCIGAMALALSVGSVVQTSANYTMSVAYATDSTQQVTKETLEALIKQEKENKPADLANASQSDKDAYDDAIKKAEEEVGTADQARLVELTNAITTAKANLGKAARETANPTPAPTPTVDENRTKLQAEVDKLKDLEITPRFTNASTAEQTEYRNAVKAAEKALKDNPTGTVPNAATLLANIEIAKKNLTGTAFSATSQREALSLTLRMANKLKTKIADNSTISNEDKDSLNTKISAADTALRNQASTSDILKEQNRILAEEIGKVVEKYNLRAEDVALTVDELKAVQTEHNQAYATAYQRLFALDAEITEFVKKDDYTKLDNTDAKNSLTTAKTNAVKVYEDSASTADQLNNAYNELYKAYNEVKTAIKPDNTETSRLKSEIIAKTQNDPDDLTKANKLAQQTYNIAKANANSVAGNADAKVEDLRDALNNLKLAELGLTPVPVKVVDDTKTELQRLTAQLKALVNEKDTIMKGDEYKNALQSSKDAYTAAVESGKSILDKQEKTLTEVNTAIATINTAKGGLRTLPSEENNKSIDELRRLIDGSSLVKESPYYLKANNTLRKSYDDALTSANKVVEKHKADKNSVSDKEISDSINALTKALNDMNYVEDSYQMKKSIDRLRSLVENAKIVKGEKEYIQASLSKKDDYDEAIENGKKVLENYLNRGSVTRSSVGISIGGQQYSRTNESITSVSLEEVNKAIKDIELALKGLGLGLEVPVSQPTSLEELILEYSDFIKKDEFKQKSISSNNYEVALTKEYIKLIDEAKKYVNGGGNNREFSANLAQAINNTKNAILGSITEYEYKLRKLVVEQMQFENTDKFKAAKNSTNETVKMAADDYTMLIARAKATLKETSRTDADLKILIDRIESSKAIITNPEIKENVAIYKLSDLIRKADKVMKDSAFLTAPQAKTDALKAAVEKARPITVKSDLKDIESAISDLESALNYKLFQDIINDKLDLNTRLESMTVVDLVKLARGVTVHKDYKDVSANHEKSLREALTAITKAMETDDTQAQVDAKKALIAALQQSTIKPITEKVLNGETGEVKINQDLINDIKALISIGDRVLALDGYKDLDKTTRDNFEKALENAKKALKSENEAEITKARDELKSALDNEKIKDLVAELGKDARAKVEDYIKGDEALRKTTNFTKAQKVHRDNYVKAIEDARKLLDNKYATDKDFETARSNIEAAVKALDGNQFAARLKALKDDFAANKFKITDANKRADIEKKLKALEDNENATMDDLLTIETELKNAQKAADNQKKVEVQTQPVNTGTTVTPVTTPTTTTTPVTTTSTVPATVNPGGIVRTGIRSLIGVVVLLALAVGAYFALSKKDKKNRTTTVNRDDEKKTRTFEGDSNENK